MIGETLTIKAIATATGVTGILGIGSYAASEMRQGERALFDSCGGVEYEINPGDSLWGIANMASMSMGELVELNDISADTVIHPNQLICIPHAVEELASDQDADNIPATPVPEVNPITNCYVYDEILEIMGDGDHEFDPPEVKAIQRALHNAGYGTEIDGKYGPQSKDDLLKFQDEHQLGADCAIGPVTYNKLLEFMDPLEGQTESTSVQTVTESQPRTEQVTADCDYQALSSAETARLLDKEGIGSDALCDAVEQFQGNHGLARDRVVGKMTARALIEQSSNPCDIYGAWYDDCFLGVQANGNLGTFYTVIDGDIISSTPARFGNDGRTNGAKTPEGHFTIFNSREGDWAGENCGTDDSGDRYACMRNPMYFEGGKAIHGTDDPQSLNGSLGCVGISDAESDQALQHYQSGVDKVVVVDFQR